MSNRTDRSFSRNSGGNNTENYHDDDDYEQRRDGPEAKRGDASGHSRRRFDDASTDEDEQKEAWGERSVRGRGKSADRDEDEFRGSESKQPNAGSAFVRADSKGGGGATKNLRDDTLMVKDISSSSSDDDDVEVSYRPQRTQRAFKPGGARPVPPKAPAGLSVVAARNTILSGSAASGSYSGSSSVQEGSTSSSGPRRAPTLRAAEGRGGTRRDYNENDDEDDSDDEGVDTRYMGRAHEKPLERRAGSPRRRGGSSSSDEEAEAQGGSGSHSRGHAPVATSSLRSETDAADRSARFTMSFAPHPGPRHEIVEREATSLPLGPLTTTTSSTASATSGIFSSNRTSTTHENSMRYSVQDMNAKLNERFKSGAFVLTAHESGGYTDLVQCLIVREKSTLAMETCYSMYLEDSNKLLIYARKKNLSRTSNYHLYDMTRGLPSKHLSKKSGNYLGKLRALNLTSTEYAVVTQASEREEVAAVVYDQVGIVDQLKDGSQPRRMNVMLPMLDADSIPIPNAVGEAEDGSMVQMLKSAQQGKMFVFRTKEPKFENGNYRLNFHGRVSVPSVKNYQLVSDEEPEHVVCQFGKIGDDRFHLDYKAPLNAFQAFAIALTQFNL